MAITKVVSIKDYGRNCWRITYNGEVLGDSQGYTKQEVINEAKKIVSRPSGQWDRNEWIEVIYVLDPAIA